MRERCIFLLLFPRFVFNVLVKQQEDEQEYESDWVDERKLFDMLLELGTQLSWQCNLLLYRPRNSLKPSHCFLYIVIFL